MEAETPPPSTMRLARERSLPAGSPIAHLVDDLREEFRRDAAGPHAAGILRRYADAHDDWRELVYFDPEEYTRNLVETNERFELLLLGWGVGHRSPLHNHEGQNCWMAVLDGRIEEQQFQLPETGRGAPIGGAISRFAPGEVAFIRDEIALHLVRPFGGVRGVSLHLYARPILECNCYCERTGRVTRQRLSYYSVRGERVAQA